MHFNPGSVEDIFKEHADSQLNIWEHSNNAYRIEKCREYIGRAIETAGYWSVVVDIGCGCGEVSGVHADKAQIIGYECNAKAVQHAVTTYRIDMRHENVQTCDVIPSDILVACDVLEHLETPFETAARWMKESNYAVISHPVDEPEGFNPGHRWIFGLSDFLRLYDDNGYEVLTYEVFNIATINIDTVIGIGKRR